MEKVDIAILGAGVVGLSCAEALASPDRSLVVVERNVRHGMETSSRNSEVIHGGMYYFPGSLKARLCVEGKDMLYAFCARHSVPFQKCGKIITVHQEADVPRLESLRKRGLENRVDDLRMMDAQEIQKLEPNIRAHAGLWSPSSGMLSADLLMDRMLELAQSRGAFLLPQTEVSAIQKTSDGYLITTNSQEPFLARMVVNAAGHGAEKIAALAGIDIDQAGYRQAYYKGEYFRLRKSPAIAHLIYPLPGKLGLGIHLSPDPGGNLRIGPSSFPVDHVNYEVDPSHRSVFLEAVKPYFPWAEENLLEPDYAGVRPKLKTFAAEHGDFILRHESDRGLPGFVNLIGIDSPGLTSAPAIAAFVCDLLKDLL